MWVMTVLGMAFAVGPDEYDARLEAEAGWTEGSHVSLDGLSDGDLPPAPPVEDKEPWARRSAPVDLPGETAGSLSGKAVYVSQCHGWIWYDSLGRFSTQRGNLYSTVEDFHNPEGANQYLIRYLENAGAMVYTVKERGMNRSQSIVDNTDLGYTEQGSGFVDGAAGFRAQSTWEYGENPFDAGGTRRFPTAEGAAAQWIVDVPEDGYYAVYVSWSASSDHATDAHYRLTHPGGVIDRRFDQTRHGSTWQHAEQLWLTEGESLTVELVGDSSQPGRYLSADAVRIGGGYGDVVRSGDLSGRPRWEEGAILYTQYNGAPTSVYDPYGDGDGSDPSSRSRWAAWEHPSGEPAVYLSWHSNAGGGTGTSTYIYEGDYTPVAGSSTFGELVHSELIETITINWDGGWYDRGVRSAAFSELSPYHNDEMPAALVELAFHDSDYDVEFLKEPAFRRDASRAMARAVIRYFAIQDGVSPVFPPEPPTQVSLLHSAQGELELSWAPGDSGAPFGDAASAYRVFRSDDGRSWDSGEVVSGTSLVLETTPGAVIYARVAAVNDGGGSFPSEVVGARRSPSGAASVLIVAAFDRLRASNLLLEDVGGAVGEVVRMDIPSINNFDGVVAHGEAVADAGWFFESVSDEALRSVDLAARSRLVFWVAGEESSEDTTFTTAQQEQVAAFVAAGGAIWATGSEVLWDLDARGGDADRAFAEGVLGALLASDDAGTTRATGEGMLDGLLLDFGQDDGSPYPVEYPDVLTSDDAVVVRYGSGGVAGTLGDGRALFGFPFECIGDAGVRAAVAERMLAALVPDYTPPEVQDDTGSLSGEAGAAPGSLVAMSELRGCGCQTGGLAGLVALVPLLFAILLRREAAT